MLTNYFQRVKQCLWHTGTCWLRFGFLATVYEPSQFKASRHQVDMHAVVHPWMLPHFLHVQFVLFYRIMSHIIYSKEFLKGCGVLKEGKSTNWISHDLAHACHHGCAQPWLSLRSGHLQVGDSNWWCNEEEFFEQDEREEAERRNSMVADESAAAAGVSKEPSGGGQVGKDGW